MASPVIHHDFIDGTNKGTGGSAYDIQNTGSLTFDTTNKVSGTSSVSLTGASANAGDCPQFPFNTGVDGLHTMSFWMKMTETSVLRYLFTTTTSAADNAHINADTLRTFVTGSWDSTANIRFGTWSALNNGNYLETFVSPPYNDFSTTGYCDGKWHHFVMVSNNSGAANSYDLYLDNVLAATNMGVNSSNGADRFMFLGGCPWSGSTLGNNQGITGNVDDFRFYDYALSSSEISSLYNEIAVQFLQPVIHYTFDTDGTNSGILGSSNNCTIPVQGDIANTSDLTTIDTTQKLLGNASIKVGTYAVYADAMPKFYFNTGTAWSISFWARHNHDSSRLGTGTNPRRALTNITKNPANTTWGERWEFSSTARGDFYCKIGSGGTNFKTDIHSHIFSDQKWHHYVISVSSNTSQTGCKFYVDNTVVPLTDLTTEFPITMEDNTDYLFILGGNHYANKSQGGSVDEAGIDGNFDEVKVYDYALSDAQIQSLYVSDLLATDISVAELLAEGFTIADLLAEGFTIADLLARGAIPDWTFDTDANHFAQSYVKDFIDISGSLVLRENSSLTVNGNIETKGNITIKNPTMAADLSLNHNMLVGGDISMNGNVTVGDISMNGKVVDCSFTDSSIPESAFNGQIGPDYTQPTILYDKGFDTTADVSMNANVQINNLKVDGNIEFSDGTTMNTYDDNKGVSYGAQFLESNLTITHSTSYEVGATPMRCSADGKYSIVHYGNTSVGANTNYDGTTATKSAILLSSDYGETYNAITLPTMPVISSTYNAVTSITGDNDFTKVDFKCMGISPSGKNIIIGISGTEQVLNNWTNTSLAWSLDYGETWETHYIKEILGAAVTGQQPSWVLFPTACAIDDAGKVAIATDKSNQYTQHPAKGIFYSVDRTSGSFMYSSAYPGKVYSLDITNNEIAFATQGVFYKLSFTGVLRSVSMPNINNSHYKYSVSQYVGNDGLCAIFMLGWQSTTTATSPCYFIKDDGTTLTAIDMSTTIAGVFTDTSKYSRMANVMSASGKYILIGGADGFADTAENVNIREAGWQVYYSEDYGATFTMNTFELHQLMPGITRNIVITDNGYIYAKYGNRDTSKFKFLSLFKASTFTSLTINNTLTAGSFSTSSDYRIKTDISQLDETVTLDNLRPVKYLQTLINKPQYGLIAHELQEYYPDLVVGEKDGKEWQRVNYTGLIPLLINEIKQLKRELTELENGM